MATVKAVKDPARWFDDLPVASARAEFPGAAATFWVIGKLSYMLDNALNQRFCGDRVLYGDVIGDRFKVSDGRFGPDYLSHLERRFSACAWVIVRPSAIAISPRAMPSKTVIRSCWS